VRSSKTVVLIGPVSVGKSVVGVRVAADLGRSFYDLDLIGETYNVEVGQPFDAFVRMIDERGVVDAHRWWQPARAHAVQRVLETHPGAVVARSRAFALRGCELLRAGAGGARIGDGRVVVAVA